MPALLAAEANGAKEKAENDVEASAGQGLWPQLSALTPAASGAMPSSPGGPLRATLA